MSTPTTAERAEQDQPPTVSDSTFEAAQTQQLLRIPIRDFPPPQGPTGFDGLPANVPAFRFSVTERPLSGPKPKEFYHTRQSVLARAPDGSIYEAYCGSNDPKEITPGHGFTSTLANRRHRYGGEECYPYDVFIGKRTNGTLTPALFFRDVGSHTTASHHLAVDSQGQCHLVVADVDIYQDNRLHLYWVIGDPIARKWTTAWIVDRRGFTSWSHPWCAAWGEKVHLVWNWFDGRTDKPATGSGAFHVEWTRRGFERKVRIVSGEVNDWDAAIDPKTGRLLVAFSKEDGVYVTSRAEGGTWTSAVRLHPEIKKRLAIAVEAPESGIFVIRTGSEDAKEWVLRPE